MTPGLGFFYSGLSAPKNALQNILLSMLSMAIVTFQVKRISGVRSGFDKNEFFFAKIS